MAKVVLHNKAFTALRSDLKVMAVLDERASRIQSAAGPGFARDQHPGGRRGRVTVYADSVRGMRAEAKNGALSRAVGSG